MGKQEEMVGERGPCNDLVGHFKDFGLCPWKALKILSKGMTGATCLFKRSLAALLRLDCSCLVE